MAPRYSVPTQLKTLMAENTPTSIEMHAERAGVERRLARHEHVVAPGEEADERDAQRRVRDRLVAEDVLARERARSTSLITPIAGSTMM